MEAAINYGAAYAFAKEDLWQPLSDEILFCIDGGAWGKKQWTACGLIVAGTACVVVSFFCPPAAGGGMTTAAKCWATAGALLVGAGSIVAI